MDNLQARVAKLNELREATKPDGSKDAQELGYCLFMYRDSIDASNDALNEAMALLQEAGEALASIHTVGMNNVCAGYSSEHVRDHNIKMAADTITKLRNAGVIV